MRILGIDPGYGLLGWSVIESGLKLVACGVIETSPQDDISQRLFVIHENLLGIIVEYHPAEAGIEKIFFSKNAKTAIDVAKCFGVVQLALRSRDIPCFEYSPTQVKLALTGSGSAQKAQVQKMVMKIFGLAEAPRPDDAADAVAVAACHSLKQRPR